MNIDVIAKGAASIAVKRFLGPFWFQRSWLARTQWLDEGQLHNIQLRRLKKIISHSYKTVPYYKKMMNEYGIKPENIRMLDDIKKFPVLSKREVLDAGESMISNKYPRWALRAAQTGGTTGTPLVIYRNLFSIGYEHAFVRRQWDWAGIKFTDRCAYLTGRLTVKPDKNDGRLYEYDPMMKELILSTYHLSSGTIRQYANAIRKYRIKAIVGYPSALYFFAKNCLEFNIHLNLKCILTSSETLTDSMREIIQRASNCKVFDYYGSAERVCYIFTCEKGNYHIIPEYGLTELIPIKGCSGNYKVISTGFWNFAMPLIRYDTGDIVTKSNENCPCLRKYHVIKSINGREADLIKTVSGRVFGAAILTHLLYGTDHILESQIIQNSLDNITIKYVPANTFSNKDMNNFENVITKHLPSELSVNFKKVEKVQRTRSGKLKPVISFSGN